MPTRLRIDIAGYHHIINRGVNRCDIFNYTPVLTTPLWMNLHFYDIIQIEKQGVYNANKVNPSLPTNLNITLN